MLSPQAEPQGLERVMGRVGRARRRRIPPTLLAPAGNSYEGNEKLKWELEIINNLVFIKHPRSSGPGCSKPIHALVHIHLMTQGWLL